MVEGLNACLANLSVVSPHRGGLTAMARRKMDRGISFAIANIFGAYKHRQEGITASHSNSGHDPAGRGRIILDPIAFEYSRDYRESIRA